MQLRTPVRGTDGFTLIELMVVVVIASILMSVAIPSYMSQIRQSRRTEAKTAILDLAGREERYFSTTPTGYTNVAANVGYAAFPQVVGTGYYQVCVSSPAAGGCAGTPNPPATWVAPAAPSYLIVVVPVAGQSQTSDTQCAAFYVDSTGSQMAINSAGADNSQLCWAN
jgi:type IV pilus assembly protein PilE